jgi:hypothetical protein
MRRTLSKQRAGSVNLLRSAAGRAGKPSDSFLPSPMPSVRMLQKRNVIA